MEVSLLSHFPTMQNISAISVFRPAVRLLCRCLQSMAIGQISLNLLTPIFLSVPGLGMLCPLPKIAHRMNGCISSSIPQMITPPHPRCRGTVRPPPVQKESDTHTSHARLALCLSTRTLAYISSRCASLRLTSENLDGPGSGYWA
jgi:hypothetical protein